MRRLIITSFKYVGFVGIFGVLFSFAMFQGGFVSWFLFYSFLPIILYYIGLFLYPIKKWQVQRNLSNHIVNVGQSVTVNITLKRKIPFPIVYCICEQLIPDSLHKKDMRHNQDTTFDDSSLTDYKRQAKRLIFPWFQRSIHSSFDFDYVPRGEHEFPGVRLRVGDLFGFVNKDYTFDMSDEFVVYPADRTAHVIRQASDYEEGSVSSYTLNLSNTNVAVGVREYTPGDRFSWIDWKQTARQQEIMTKEFEEEKSLDMMVVLNGMPYEEIKPIAFEGAVELTLALIKAFVKYHSQIGLLSFGEEVARFSSDETTLNREQILHHLARIQPVKKQPLSQKMKEELLKFNGQYIFLFITTTLDAEVKRTIDYLRTRSKKIVVIYLHGKQSVTNEEEANLQYMISQNIHVHHMTELQLEHDPIEVKF